MVDFAIKERVRILVVGDLKGIAGKNAGRVQNLRLRQWRRTLLGALQDKAELAGIIVRLVDERGTSSTCPACQQRVPKPTGRHFCCPHCRFQGHRDLVGAANIAAKVGGGPTSTGTSACRAPSRRQGAGGVTDAATSTMPGGVGLGQATPPRRSGAAWVSLAARPRPGAWRGSSNVPHQGKRCLKRY